MSEVKAAKSFAVTVVVSEKQGGVKPYNDMSRSNNRKNGGEELAEKLGDSHMNLLPRKQLLIVLLSVSMGMFIAFADQTAVTVSMNEIGKDLHSQSTINWAGTASLLANTVCQVLFGRLSDIFGRKTIFLSCLCILGFADLACGFAQTGVQYFIFRAFAGIGNGGVSSLSMVIMSDVVTLKQRGKYQGILGASVGLGNAVGPFIMAAFISRKKEGWRDFYHLFAPLVFCIAVAIYFLVPKKDSSNSGNVLTKTEKLKKIDYLGVLTSAASLTLILVPLSGGGSTYAWNSPLVISMFSIGGVLFIAFVLIEWKIPELPMIPLRLFKNPSLCIILGSNFFFGMTYYSLLFYLPYYFQIIRGRNEIESSVFLLPIVLTQALMSTISGNFISFTGRYIHTVLFGYTLWTIGCGLLLLWSESTSYGVLVLILIVIGIGIGATFQPTMIAAQAQAKKADRAVVISTRNVIRSFGGAAGIAVASTVISNSLVSDINLLLHGNNPQHIPASYLKELEQSIYRKIDLKDLTIEQATVIRHMYMKAMKNYFYLLIPFIGICLIGSAFVKDRGLQCIDEVPALQGKGDREEVISTRTSRTDYTTDIESNIEQSR